MIPVTASYDGGSTVSELYVGSFASSQEVENISRLSKLMLRRILLARLLIRAQ
jgi:hypothetical protein